MFPNEALLTAALLGCGAYFSVLLVRDVLGYLSFRRRKATALLTWRGHRPAHFPLLVSLGVLSLAVAILNLSLARPVHHVYSQAVIAVYFIVMVPLSARIQRGFYRDGVWAEAGFLPYRKIDRFAFLERPELVLVLLPRGKLWGSYRLPIPPGEYGAVRKILEEMSRAHIVNVGAAILRL